MSLFKNVFLLLRVPLWTKVFFVFLGVIYANIPDYGLQAFGEALVFCLIVSAVYSYNDLQDMKEDKAHPKKSHRPLASEDVSASFAVMIAMLATMVLMQ